VCYLWSDIYSHFKDYISLAVALLSIAFCLPLHAEGLSIERLEVGSPIQHKNLALFPIISKAKPSPEIGYLTLDEGLASGKVVITETGGEATAQQNLQPNLPREAQETQQEAQIQQQEIGQEAEIGQRVQEQIQGGSAQVNVLAIRNDSDLPLYLMAGEMIQGAKQDRMVAHDVIIPPGSKDIPLDVFCVEAGRWSFQSETFSSAKAVTGVQLRSTAQTAKSQDEVWEKVSEYNKAVGASSPTGNLKAAYEKGEVQSQIKEYMSVLEKELKGLNDAVGVVVVINDRIALSDLFGSSHLFSRLQDKLLTSYIMDAIVEKGTTKLTLTSREIREYLRLLLSSEKVKDIEDGNVEIYQIKSEKVKGTISYHRGRELHLNSF
jgi:hypothetical protein